MKQEELVHPTDEELLQQQKKMKSSNTANALLIGILIGITLYSAVNYGFGLPTLLPLIFAFILFKKKPKP